MQVFLYPIPGQQFFSFVWTALQTNRQTNTRTDTTKMIPDSPAWLACTVNMLKMLFSHQIGSILF